MPLRTLSPSQLASLTQDTPGFENRVLLVTGATGGLGREVVIQSAKLGARLILLAKDEKRLDDLYDEVINLKAPEPLIIQVDLNTLDAQQAQAVSEAVHEYSGRLDGLLHCAAMLGELKPLDQYPPTLWHQVFNTNIHAAFLLTQSCMSLMRESEDASVIFVSPQQADLGGYWGAYGVCAGALRALAEAWAAELEHTCSIRVNLVNPGPIRTPMRASAFPAKDPAAWISPAQVVPVFLHLLGSTSNPITATHLDLSLINSP